MTQPIQPSGPSAIPRTQGHGAGSAGAGGSGGARSAAASTGNAGGNDRVDLSSAARALAEANQALGDTPEVDLERVASIRSAIENGTYHVDPQRVAEKFLAIEGALEGALNDVRPGAAGSQKQQGCGR